MVGIIVNIGIIVFAVGVVAVGIGVGFTELVDSNEMGLVSEGEE